MNAQLNFQNNAIHGETTAEQVIQSDTNIAEIVSNISPLGWQLLQSADEKTLRRILQTEKDIYFDEKDNIWAYGGTKVTSTNSTYVKFGSGVGTNSSRWFNKYFTLGGDPFTIQFWAYVNAPTSALTQFFSYGSAIYMKSYSPGTSSPYIRVFVNNNSTSKDLSGAPNGLHNFEFGYRSGNLYCFVDGVLKATVSGTVSREGRTLQFGGYSVTAYISELRILDGQCAHTADFTPPTKPYTLTDNTVSLLHFEGIDSL